MKHHILGDTQALFFQANSSLVQFCDWCICALFKVSFYLLGILYKSLKIVDTAMGKKESYLLFYLILDIIIDKKNHIFDPVESLSITFSYVSRSSGYLWVYVYLSFFLPWVRCYDTEQRLDERDRHPINSREKHDLYPVSWNSEKFIATKCEMIYSVDICTCTCMHTPTTMYFSTQKNMNFP